MKYTGVCTFGMTPGISLFNVEREKFSVLTACVGLTAGNSNSIFEANTFPLPLRVNSLRELPHTKEVSISVCDRKGRAVCVCQEGT